MKTGAIQRFLKRKGFIRTKEFVEAGFSRNNLSRLVRSGFLVKDSRGLYRCADEPIPELFDLIEVTKRVPHAVICLVSALSYYGLTTQIPHGVWIALPKGAWRPKSDFPMLNLTFVSGAALDFGVQEFKAGRETIRIYSPAKTIADCFKFRNKVGLDVAIEALKEIWRKKMATVDELMESAKICRVARIMQPYMEAIV